MDTQSILQQALGAYTEGRLDDAIIVLEKMLKTDNTCASGWDMLGNAYARSHQHQDAIKAFQEVAKLYPTRSESHANMANSYMAVGDFASAVKEYEEALKINPNDVVAKANLPQVKGLAGASSVEILGAGRTTASESQRAAAKALAEKISRAGRKLEKKKCSESLLSRIVNIFSGKK